MSSLRERVGQAIYEENGGGGAEAWVNLTRDRKEPWMRDADRAFTAMRVVELGFASFSNKEYELIVRDPITGDEITLYGRLRDDQDIVKIDKVLPTCLYINGVPLAAPAVTPADGAKP